jgi:hypothetical protein
LGKDGRGLFFYSGIRIIASRMAFFVATGRFLEKGDFACHSCDNPPCCNPNHIWAGDASSNALDKQLKNRAKKNKCAQGHPLIGDNLGIMRSGRRYCRTCVTERWRIQKARKDAQPRSEPTIADIPKMIRKLSAPQRRSISDSHKENDGIYWLPRTHMNALWTLHKLRLVDCATAPAKLTELGIYAHTLLKDASHG